MLGNIDRLPVFTLSIIAVITFLVCSWAFYIISDRNLEEGFAESTHETEESIEAVNVASRDQVI